jgi:hypothetical protein
MSAKKQDAQKAPSLEDLLGDETEVPDEVKADLGTIVLFHTNNPEVDGVLSYPAIVTKINQNGSVSLTVFADNHQMYFSKIPLAERPLAGYYSLK